MKQVFFVLLAVITINASCKKETSNIPILPNETKEYVAADRYTDFHCPTERSTVHYTQLANDVHPAGNAFMNHWMQLLDSIANACVLDNSICDNPSATGKELFISKPEFNLYTMLQLGGFAGTWPYVTPAGQDFIIAYTLNWARTHLPVCPQGSVHLVAVDYTLLHGNLDYINFVVLWECCGNTAIGDE